MNLKGGVTHGRKEENWIGPITKTLYWRFIPILIAFVDHWDDDFFHLEFSRDHHPKP